MMDFNLLSLNFRENPQKFSLEIPDNQQASESFITLIDPEITDTLRFKYLYMIKNSLHINKLFVYLKRREPALQDSVSKPRPGRLFRASQGLQSEHKKLLLSPTSWKKDNSWYWNLTLISLLYYWIQYISVTPTDFYNHCNHIIFLLCSKQVNREIWTPVTSTCF